MGSFSLGTMSGTMSVRHRVILACWTPLVMSISEKAIMHALNSTQGTITGHGFFEQRGFHNLNLGGGSRLTHFSLLFNVTETQCTS